MHVTLVLRQHYIIKGTKRGHSSVTNDQGCYGVYTEYNIIISTVGELQQLNMTACMKLVINCGRMTDIELCIMHVKVVHCMGVFQNMLFIH